MTDNPTKRPRGRPFEKGNHGRPAGSKNRKTQIQGSLSDEEQHRLVRLAYDMAMAGEIQLLKSFLPRILPKDRLIQIDEVPMGLLADEAPDVIAATLKAVCTGQNHSRRGRCGGGHRQPVRPRA
jgi:hypothetical protein